MDEGPFKAGTEIDDEYMKAYQQAEDVIRSSETGITPLGSGSDYTVFLQRLGVCMFIFLGSFSQLVRRWLVRTKVSVPPSPMQFTIIIQSMTVNIGKKCTATLDSIDM